MATVTATESQTRTMRRILELLAGAGGTLQRTDIQAALRNEWEPTDPHDIEVQSNGQERGGATPLGERPNSSKAER